MGRSEERGSESGGERGGERRGEGRRMGRRGYMTYSIFAPGSSQQCKFETLL